MPPNPRSGMPHSPEHGDSSGPKLMPYVSDIFTPHRKPTKVEDLADIDVILGLMKGESSQVFSKLGSDLCTAVFGELASRPRPTATEPVKLGSAADETVAPRLVAPGKDANETLLPGLKAPGPPVPESITSHPGRTRSIATRPTRGGRLRALPLGSSAGRHKRTPRAIAPKIVVPPLTAPGLVTSGSIATRSTADRRKSLPGPIAKRSTVRRHKSIPGLNTLTVVVPQHEAAPVTPKRIASKPIATRSTAGRHKSSLRPIASKNVAPELSTRRPAASGTVAPSASASRPSAGHQKQTPIMRSSLTISAAKQANTILCIYLPPSEDCVPLRLRSCMTMSSFFESALGAFEIQDQVEKVAALRVTFERGSDGRTESHWTQLVKQGIPDSFEIFLDIINGLPDMAGVGRSQVKVEIMMKSSEQERNSIRTSRYNRAPSRYNRAPA